jgi:YebC/PmpR family DNA-binding regulatory protein
MSGHSKWSTIKRKKGAVDAKRGKVFTRLIKELTIAARMGGSNPEGNPRLRTAIAGAKAENMPKDNIERAIKKGAGELDGATYEEITYEGYGPGGAAVLVEVMTDNKNRSAADIRHIFTKNNGTLGESNCVAYMFDKKGVIVYEKDAVDEDQLMEAALDAGADDVVEDEGTLSVFTSPKDFYTVKEALDANEAVSKYSSAEISMVPQNTVQLTGKHAEQVLRMMEALEDNDDVQNAYSNFDISDEEMEKLS